MSPERTKLWYLKNLDIFIPHGLESFRDPKWQGLWGFMRTPFFKADRAAPGLQRSLVLSGRYGEHQTRFFPPQKVRRALNDRNEVRA